MPARGLGPLPSFRLHVLTTSEQVAPLVLSSGLLTSLASRVCASKSVLHDAASLFMALWDQMQLAFILCIVPMGGHAWALCCGWKRARNTADVTHGGRTGRICFLSSVQTTKWLFLSITRKESGRNKDMVLV